MTETIKGMQDLKSSKDGSHRCKSKRKTCDMLPLEEFMAECLKNLDKIKDKEKPSMNTLRHYIPLLVIVLFPSEEQGNKMKVKGMWDNIPEGWPSNVAFKDPNNAKEDPKTKKKGRPTHKTLMDMFLVLLDKYQIQQSVESIKETEDNITHPISQSTLQSTSAPLIPFHCVPIEEKYRPEILNHIKSKILIVEQKQQFETTNVSLLHRVEETLVNICDTNGRQPRFFQVAHEFECLLDCIIECDCKFDQELQQKWHKFADDMDTKDLLLQYVDAIEMSEGLPADLSTLNIRAESPNALQALQAGGRLEIRYNDTDVLKPDKFTSVTFPKVSDDDLEDQKYKKLKLQSLEESEMYINDVMKSDTQSMISGLGVQNNGAAMGNKDEGVLSQAMLVSGICESDPSDSIDPASLMSRAFEPEPDSAFNFEVEDGQDVMYNGNLQLLNTMGIDEIYSNIDRLASDDVALDETVGPFTVASYESVTATTEIIIESPEEPEGPCISPDTPGKLNQYQIQELDPMLPSVNRSTPALSTQHSNDKVAVVIENRTSGSHQTASVMFGEDQDSRFGEGRHVEDMETDDL